MHIKAVFQCLPSLTLPFQGAVDNAFMQLFKQQNMAGLNKKGISRTTWKGSPMNIQIRHLKGILEERVVNAAPVVYDTGC